MSDRGSLAWVAFVGGVVAAIVASGQESATWLMIGSAVGGTGLLWLVVRGAIFDAMSGIDQERRELVRAEARAATEATKEMQRDTPTNVFRTCRKCSAEYDAAAMQCRSCWKPAS